MGDMLLGRNSPVDGRDWAGLDWMDVKVKHRRGYALRKGLHGEIQSGWLTGRTGYTGDARVDAVLHT